MSKVVESFEYKSARYQYIIIFASPSKDLQYFGRNCRALATTIGGLDSKKPLTIWTSKKRLEIWLLTKSDLLRIMDLLSDVAGQFLENIQRAGIVTNREPFVAGRGRFEPT